MWKFAFSSCFILEKFALLFHLLSDDVCVEAGNYFLIFSCLITKSFIFSWFRDWIKSSTTSQTIEISVSKATTRKLYDWLKFAFPPSSLMAKSSTESYRYFNHPLQFIIYNTSRKVITSEWKLIKIKHFLSQQIPFISNSVS